MLNHVLLQQVYRLKYWGFLANTQQTLQNLLNCVLVTFISYIKKREMTWMFGFACDLHENLFIMSYFKNVVLLKYFFKKVVHSFLTCSAV